MELTYRGSRYRMNSQSVNQQTTEQDGLFRGHRFKIKRPVSTSARRPTQCLRYRGALYFA